MCGGGFETRALVSQKVGNHGYKKKPLRMTSNICETIELEVKEIVIEHFNLGRMKGKRSFNTCNQISDDKGVVCVVQSKISIPY